MSCDSSERKGGDFTLRKVTLTKDVSPPSTRGPHGCQRQYVLTPNSVTTHTHTYTQETAKFCWKTATYTYFYAQVKL